MESIIAKQVKLTCTCAKSAGLGGTKEAIQNSSLVNRMPASGSRLQRTNIGSVLERPQQLLQQHRASKAEHVVHEDQDAALPASGIPDEPFCTTKLMTGVCALGNPAQEKAGAE